MFDFEWKERDKSTSLLSTSGRRAHLLAEGGPIRYTRPFPSSSSSYKQKTTNLHLHLVPIIAHKSLFPFIHLNTHFLDRCMTPYLPSQKPKSVSGWPVPLIFWLWYRSRLATFFFFIFIFCLDLGSRPNFCLTQPSQVSDRSRHCSDLVHRPVSHLFSVKKIKKIMHLLSLCSMVALQSLNEKKLLKEIGDG